MRKSHLFPALFVSFVTFLGILVFFPPSSAFAQRRPILTPDYPGLLGAYRPKSPGAGCSDEGRGICEGAVISERQSGNERALTIYFGRGNYELPLRQSGGALVFAQRYDESCDSPQCGNVKRIFGAVFLHRLRGAWQPVIKVSTIVDFPFPETEGDPEGRVTSSAFLVK